MVYPVRAHATLATAGDPAKKDRLPVPFGPLRPGLVSVVLVAHHGSLPRSRFGEGTPAFIDVTVELRAPGTDAPVLRLGRPVKIAPGEINEAIFHGDVMASAAQAVGGWMATVINHEPELTANFDLTIRFQTQDGNLGKIDHIVVVMLENRSFDHMLGYLKAQRVIPDVDGLTGDEVNPDDSGHPVRVHALARTTFFGDPGHGWPDVAGPAPESPPDANPPAHVQLEGFAAFRLPSNAGFVRNFVIQQAKERPDPPHDHTLVADGATHRFTFRPAASGRLGVRSVPIDAPRVPSDAPLGDIVVRRPDSTPLPNIDGATPVRSPRGLGVLSAQYAVGTADAQLGGAWHCEITNRSGAALVFVTDITNAIDPANVEKSDAVMGFHTAKTVPTYDFLARQYAVCDRWFASIPTDTFPNRLYAMAGGAGGLITTPSDAQVASDPPGYDLTTIFEVLQSHGVDWRIYFSDLPFALVFAGLARDAQYTANMLTIDSLAQAARIGDLPSFAWIDPNFNDVPDGSGNASDDHPPGDVARGQDFVAQVYATLVDSPAWAKTLLIVTYDEHGGFFDHVRPPGTPPLAPTDDVQDDDPNLRRYGVRVPALVASPWIDAGHVAKTVYDHTSVLRTALLRFCGPAVPSMGRRTDSANDLGAILSRATPREPVAMTRLAAVRPNAATASSSPAAGIGATIRRILLGI